MAEKPVANGVASHGAAALPSVTVDSFNLELKDENGFVGDQANKAAFDEFLSEWRDRLRKLGDDPLGDEKLSGKELEKALKNGPPEAAGLVHSTIEDFAQQLVSVIRRFLRTSGWKDTERVAVGGGLRGSRLGEIAIGRAAVLLKGDGIDIELAPISHDPDEAGLLGAAHLAPAWIFTGHDAIFAVDIGGTNIRAGVVRLNLKKSDTLSHAEIWRSELWRHADDEPDREEVVGEIVAMLGKLAKAAGKEGLTLAPFVGIGVPGVVNADGTIDRGAQNMPGNWHSSRFKLPALIVEKIPDIGGNDTVVVMHNDAVVQGLSEVPNMQDVARWGVLTIGTGLGNARFTNRAAETKKKTR
jgi:predicted NBD/HSP70 family sugar kinase